MAFLPTVHAFIRDEQQCARPFLVTMGPFDTAIVEPPEGLGRLLLTFKHEHVHARNSKYATCSALMLSSQLTLQANKLPTIPHHHTLTRWQNTYKYNVRPIAFDIPKYQSKAPTDGQPESGLRVPTGHEVRPTPHEMALTIDSCHLPAGQFVAAIGKRKTARLEKGKTQSRASGQKGQHWTSCAGVTYLTGMWTDPC